MRIASVRVAEEKSMLGRPPVVCLCGSTRFAEEFHKANRDFTLEGWIVLTVGFFLHQDPVGISEVQKEQLDQLHLDKIDMADYVYVINKGGYIGSSTRAEIEFADKLGKLTFFMEPQL